MKTAVSAVDKNKDSKVDSRFGRAKYFVLYDSDSKNWGFVENSLQMDSSHGAGIQTAQNLAREGVNAVITGHCGPNAWRVLSTAGIKVYFVGSRSVEEAVNEMLEGKLKSSDGADVQGHWQS